MVRGISRKGAMELSMNTIVVVVIGITLLVLGLVFVRTIFLRMSETTEKTFAGADTVLEDITGTDQKLNVQTAIKVKPGQTVKVPIKVCDIEGLGGAVTLKIIATKLTHSKVTVYVPEIDGLTDINKDGTYVSKKEQILETGRCVAYQMFIEAKPGAPVSVGSGSLFAFKTISKDGKEYGSTGSIISVAK